MQVLSVEELAPPPLDPPRSGVHLSSIIKRMLLAKDRKRYGGPVTDAVRLRWESGFLWEILFSKALANSKSLAQHWGYDDLLPQQPRVLDGIVTTVDFFSRPIRTVVETKATLLSAAHSIESDRYWAWRVQVKGYCWVWDTDRADIIAFHMRGDYGEDQRPMARRYRLQFSYADLKKNWQMVLVNRDALLREGRREGRRRMRA